MTHYYCIFQHKTVFQVLYSLCYIICLFLLIDVSYLTFFMDEDFNETYITLGGHVELDKYRYLYFMIVSLLYGFIICSNSTIVYIIWFHKNLHQPMYIFIAALLINSVLYSTVVFPKLLIDFLTEKQVISYSACHFQSFMYYCIGCSEMLLLLAMAYDRYVSICKPLHYATIMRKTTVIVFLTLAWFVPVCELMVPLLLNGNRKLCSFTLKVVFCNNSIYNLHCVRSRAQYIYGIFLLVHIIFLPMFFILFTYTKIFRIISHSSTEFRRKAIETCLPHLLVLINIFLLGTFHIFTVRLENDLPKILSLILSLHMVLYHPLFNPFIYGLKLKEISRHLKKLLLRQN